MTKDVIISIKGLQFESDLDEDKVETITRGQYYKKNKHHYVIYEEILEGFTGNTKNVIRFNDQELNLTKKGIVNVHMLFEENKKNITNYITPYGSIQIGIDAKNIQLQEEEEMIGVTVEYALEVNYEHLADCKIIMDIRSKDAQAFSLGSHINNSSGGDLLS